ncbi:MAG: polysaccharide deacetylase family protein [Candidatus Omnitrophica bacterium]|nr:polysaccharide deacetylase family protein [Candidatus Omnitrophota bacterium]
MFKRIFLTLLLIAVVSFSCVSLWVSNHYIVPIIMYHHVNETVEIDPMVVSDKWFRWQMEYLKKHYFDVISLDEFVKAKLEGKKLSKKSVVITFDDGFEDNYTYAYPILKEYGFPATIFVPSNQMGLEGQMTLTQLKEIAADELITIGSHTREHLYLPDLQLEEQKAEIFGSKEELERLLNVQIEHFAYPVGGFDETSKQFIKDAGYKSASTTNRGHDRYNNDLFELNRIRFSNKDCTNDILWMKLSGYYNVFRKLKNSH